MEKQNFAEMIGGKLNLFYLGMYNDVHMMCIWLYMDI